jgi:hypothetical protein
MLGILGAIAKFIFTTTQGQTLIAMVLVWLGLKNSKTEKYIEKALAIAQEVYELIEAWAKSQSDKPSGELKREMALKVLKTRLQGAGIKPTKKIKTGALKLWEHLGWANKITNK